MGTGALGWRPLVWSGQDGRGQPGRWEGSAEEVAEWRPAPPFPSPPRLFRGGGVRPVALASSPSPSRGRCDLLGAVSARALCPSSPSAGLWGCWGPFTCPSISRGATRVSGWTRHGNLPRHHPPNTPTLRRGGGGIIFKRRGLLGSRTPGSLRYVPRESGGGDRTHLHREKPLQSPACARSGAHVCARSTPGDLSPRRCRGSGGGPGRAQPLPVLLLTHGNCSWDYYTFLGSKGQGCALGAS